MTEHITHTVVTVSLSALLWAGNVHAEQPDYFPLQVGDRWVYAERI